MLSLIPAPKSYVDGFICVVIIKACFRFLKALASRKSG